MLELITRFIQPVVRIRREEWRKALLMFLYFAFTIATLYILKPVRSSLFLTVHGAESLRYAYVGEGIFLILITFAYVQLSRWLVRKNTLFSVTVGFFVLNILIFWALFKAGYLEWMSYLFYFWVAAYSITIVTQCWTLANDIFNPQEAKRLFGFIVSGGSLGGIFGGLITNRYAERMGTENLLLLAALFLCLCVVLINLIWKYEHVQGKEEKIRKKKSISSSSLPEKSTWKLFFGSRYLLLIAVLVMIAKIASTIVDNQFNSVVEISILEKNARTAFFGSFWAFLNGIAFFLQLVVASYALRHLGIGISLLLLPVGLALGSVATIFFPILGLASVVKIYDGSMNYSINQLGKEILYLPIPSRIRYRIKPVIDMLAYRFSKTVAGFMIILITPLLGISDERLGLIVLLLIPLWVLAVWFVRDEYVQSIRKLISNPKAMDRTLHPPIMQATDVLVHLEGERSFERLKAFLTHRSSVTRKISAAACLAFHSSARDVKRIRKLVEEMIRYEALELKGVNLNRLFHGDTPEKNDFFDRRLLEILRAKRGGEADLKILFRQYEQESLLKISECLSDPEESAPVKRKAILLLTTLGTQGAVDILLNSIASVKDRAIRFDLIRALNRIKARGEQREFNKWIIKKEIMVEAKTYKSLLVALREYKKRTSVSNPEEDYLLATLHALRQESLERIFRLLGLIYDTGMIHLIYDRLVEIEADQHVLANALELLENILEPELVRALHVVFDGTEWEDKEKKNLEGVIREFFESQDQWFIVCAIFLIVELDLKELHGELENIAHSQVPVIQEAAGIALLKVKRGK
ncbi:MAG: MFS transporter [Candidatus Omnitrophica bacterium]|nr:MFS transporter [Candidatus Omnitrophota bacterium]